MAKKQQVIPQVSPSPLEPADVPEIRGEAAKQETAPPRMLAQISMVNPPGYRNAGQINFLLRELNRLQFDSDEEKRAVEASIHWLSYPLESLKSFDDAYANNIAFLEPVLALLSQYKDAESTVKDMEQAVRSTVDANLSEAVNPQTGKAYTRGAIEAMIKGHSDVTHIQAAGRIASANIRFLNYLYDLFKMHHERILNTNINARRAWDTQAG
jgi:hypothetical protein